MAGVLCDVLCRCLDLVWVVSWSSPNSLHDSLIVSFHLLPSLLCAFGSQISCLSSCLSMVISLPVALCVGGGGRGRGVWVCGCECVGVPYVLVCGVYRYMLTCVCTCVPVGVVSLVTSLVYVTMAAAGVC